MTEARLLSTMIIVLILELLLDTHIHNTRRMPLTVWTRTVHITLEGVTKVESEVKVDPWWSKSAFGAWIHTNALYMDWNSLHEDDTKFACYTRRGNWTGIAQKPLRRKFVIKIFGTSCRQLLMSTLQDYQACVSERMVCKVAKIMRIRITIMLQVVQLLQQRRQTKSVPWSPENWAV